MRFRLKLEPTSKQRIIPVNYQYELSSWIYKVLHYGNPEFAGWLHEHGYLSGRKQFKYFTFSNLITEKARVSGDRLELSDKVCYLDVSFFLEEAVETFVMGIFRNQEFRLGDRLSQVQFNISGIEKLAEPLWAETMHFRTQSPVVVSFQYENSSTATYLAPGDVDYEKLFFKNLQLKLQTLSLQKGEIFRFEAFESSGGNMRFSNIKSKLIRIKTGTPQQSSIKGYLFDFSLTAPVEFMKVGYYSGFGEKGSMGFGSVVVIQY